MKGSAYVDAMGSAFRRPSLERLGASEQVKRPKSQDRAVRTRFEKASIVARVETGKNDCGAREWKGEGGGRGVLTIVSLASAFRGLS